MFTTITTVVSIVVIIIIITIIIIIIIIIITWARPRANRGAAAELHLRFGDAVKVGW